MTEQHPSSKLTITRERYDELANAGLNDEQITELTRIGSSNIATAAALVRLGRVAETAATGMDRLADALATPREHLNSRGITYTNRAARRKQARKGRP